jgi:hypothetical protein
MGSRGWCGGQFSVGPDGAIFEELLLPDGDGALEGVDGEAASVKGCGAMGGAYGDEDAGFADFKAAEAVDNSQPMDGEPFVDGVADLANFREGHGFVGLVFEVECTAAVRFVAYETVEGDDGSIVVSADFVGNCRALDGRMDQGEKVVVYGGPGHGWR